MEDEENTGTTTSLQDHSLHIVDQLIDSEDEKPSVAGREMCALCKIEVPIAEFKVRLLR